MPLQVTSNCRHNASIRSLLTFILTTIIPLLGLAADDGRNLPPGVPRSVSAEGLNSVPLMFSSKAYEAEALRLLIREANTVASQLQLPEALPITQEDVVRPFVNPFGYSYSEKKIGNITTLRYFYGVEQGDKFSDLVVADYDKFCANLRERGRWPISRMDTTVPFQLATQWLAKLSMDVKSLNLDCKVHVAVSPFWNELRSLGEKPHGADFIPIYTVWWESVQNREQGSGSVAFVELFLPEKRLLQLIVSDEKYILRSPLNFTNLAKLFPGTAMIRTNRPVAPVILRPPVPDPD